MLLASKPGINGMIGGQTLDVVLSGKKISDDQLEYIYLNKTSALIECAMMIGTYLAGADEQTVNNMEQVARAVGMAFQVQDDILDIVGDENVIGKPVHSDEKNEKYTYVTIHGIENAHNYVREMSEKANNILQQIEVKNEDVKFELCKLINSLIDRDR